MKKIFLLLTALCSLLTSCSEDVVSTFGSVYGIIYDASTAAPLRNVSVTLSPGNMTTITGNDGQYEFTDLEPGQYKLLVDSEGYDQNSRQVTILPSVRIVCDFHISATVVNQTLKVTPSSLNFGANQDELSVTIINEGSIDTDWSVDMGNNSWLTAKPSSGRIAAGKTQVIVFSVNREIISSDKSVIVNLAAFGNSYPISISCAPVQKQDLLTVYPQSLNFGTLQNSLTLTLENISTYGNISYTAESSNKWLILSKTSGVVAQTDYLDVVVSREGLSAGEYNATITIYDSKKEVLKTVDAKMEVAVNQKPAVSIETVDGAGYDQVLLTGTILSVGSSAIIKHGFCWSDKSEPTIDDASSNLGDCSTPLAFEYVVTGLKANTKYYFRAYAENALGISYSQKELSWTTSDIPSPPAVTTGEISQITQTTALAQGEITSLCNGGEITAYGHVWSTSENPTLFTGKCVDFGKTPESKSFNSQLSDLVANTEYFVRAYATNAIGTNYGECVKFITAKADLNIETLPAIDIIHNAATCGGEINGYKGHTIVEKGVCYSTKSMPTISDSTVQATDLATSSVSIKDELIPAQTIVIPDQYTCRVTGLTTETTYYVRAYAKTDEGKIFYGNEESFVTTKEVFLPTLTDVDVSNIQTTSATVVSKILSDGNGTITECGFCYSETAEPTIDNSTKITCDVASTELGKNITELKDNTLYHVRAFAKNAMGVAYSKDAEFTTLAVTNPTLADVDVSNIQTTSATVVSKILSDGNSFVSECGFCYSETAEPTIDNGTTILCDVSSSEMGKNITGLKDNTLYHVRAFAKNAKGVAYSKDAEFTTISITTPILSSVNAKGIGRTTAYVSATITDTGNATLSECGFCWSLSPYPTIYDNKVVCDTQTSFSTKLQELPLLTTVYVRAYAINTKGTGYSEDTSFTTTDTDIDIWDGVSVATKFGGGMGTESDPIIINTADQLKLLADNVRSGKSSYADIYFRLDINIRLENHEWSPIGFNNDSRHFEGIFDGNNKTIDGLYIYSGGGNDGLFGANRGTIKSLTVKGYISAGSYSGGICGLNRGTIQDCTSEVTISGSGDCIGGICGSNHGNIHRSINKGTVSGKNSIGGIAGKSNNYSGCISNCKNYGSISGLDKIGGIYGDVELCDYASSTNSLIVYNCLNAGTINATLSAGGVIGHIYIQNQTMSITGSTYTNICISNNCNIASIYGETVGGMCGLVVLSGSRRAGVNWQDNYVRMIMENCCSSGHLQGLHNGGLSGVIDWKLYSKYGSGSFGGGTAYAESISKACFNSSYWLYNIVNNIGTENITSSTSRYSIDNSNWFNYNASGCYLKGSNEDIVSLLNNWVTYNSNTATTYLRWEYEIINGYATPVFE